MGREVSEDDQRRSQLLKKKGTLHSPIIKVSVRPRVNKQRKRATLSQLPVVTDTRCYIDGQNVCNG